MCESNAFLLRPEGEELVLEDVAVMEPVDGGYRLRSLFGEEAVVKGRLREVNLIKHRIVFSED